MYLEKTYGKSYSKDFDPKIVEETCTADLDELCRKDGASRKEEKARVRSIWEITGC